MEVIGRAEQGLQPSADTFVSLRVGQVQRHARFAPARTYKFESVDATSKEPVKLEVFKRIGHTTITFGGTTGDIQDVEIPVSEGSTMRMRLQTQNARATTPAGMEKKKSGKVNGARTYLAQHNLEELIKDAMKEVMNVKPDDPHGFLAAYILGAKSFLPKIKAAAEKQSDKPMPAKWEFTGDDKYWNKAMFVPQPRSLPPIDAGILHRCCQVPPVIVPEPLPEPTFAIFNHRPSAGTWVMLKPTREPEVVEPEPVPEYRSFGLRPSVGTWAGQLPSGPDPLDETAYRKFTLRPSVGTWCAVKQQRPLEELTNWLPSKEESEAMGVILKGRQTEIRDLTDKMREVGSYLNVARTQGTSSEVAELVNTQQALERCVAYAQSEYDALEQWGHRRGLSQPSSPVQGFR